MKLDRACLGGHELEALQETRGESRVTAHRRPFDSVELPALSQHRRVDCDLAEVVQPTRPPEPVYLRERKLQRTREPVDITRNPQRVAVGGRIALVDDVGEGLECAERFALQA